MLVEKQSLRVLNTFAVDVNTRFYASISKIGQIHEFFPEIFRTGMDYLILGEGSNLLFTADFPGVIIHNKLKGIEKISEDKEHVLLRACAGENWDNFVEMTVQKGYGGLENLSLIPGSVGSSPVQNIGAYGVEAKDRIVQVEGYTLPGLDFRIIKKEDCQFGYRDSIFKNEWKGRFFITAVVFKLDKHPVFELGYGAVAEVFRKKEKQDLLSLRDTIIEIRKSKLPDPQEFGNAGSFFKNPVVTLAQYEGLKAKWAVIPGHSAGAGLVKIPAAWLIEKAGWKGVREGNVGTWKWQPLVIVNYGSASGKEIFEFSEGIRKSVLEKFGIGLEREVNVVGG